MAIHGDHPAIRADAAKAEGAVNQRNPGGGIAGPGIGRNEMQPGRLISGQGQMIKRKAKGDVLRVLFQPGEGAWSARHSQAILIQGRARLQYYGHTYLDPR